MQTIQFRRVSQYIDEWKRYANYRRKTIQIINAIAQRVGAPTYQRTPIFKKRGNGGGRQGPRQRQRATITANDWSEMRNFKVTKLEKNEAGIEVYIDKLRTFLNKITASNYNDMCREIIKTLGHILDSNPPEADILKVGEAIFEIGSANTFWSEMYAALYKDLIKTFPIMESICNKTLDSFLELFTDIVFVSADEDYDKFCEINKINSKRRALSAYFIHLMNYGVVTTELMLELTVSLKNNV